MHHEQNLERPILRQCRQGRAAGAPLRRIVTGQRDQPDWLVAFEIVDGDVYDGGDGKFQHISADRLDKLVGEPIEHGTAPARWDAASAGPAASRRRKRENECSLGRAAPCRGRAAVRPRVAPRIDATGTLEQDQRALGRADFHLDFGRRAPVATDGTRSRPRWSDFDFGDDVEIGGGQCRFQLSRGSHRARRAATNAAPRRASANDTDLDVVRHAYRYIRSRIDFRHSRLPLLLTISRDYPGTALRLRPKIS